MTQPPSSERAPRMRVARGPKRPDYLGNRDLDRFMMMFAALMSEVSALRERLDTHELLAASGQVATPEAIEAFDVPTEDIARRDATRDALLRRVFRVALEELEEAQHDEPADFAKEQAE